MPIHYDTIENGQNKKSHLLFSKSVVFACWEESITHNADELATQHRRLLPRRWCTNHRPVCDVLAQHTSCLDYTLFVKGTLDWIIGVQYICLPVPSYFSQNRPISSGLVAMPFSKSLKLCCPYKVLIPGLVFLLKTELSNNTQYIKNFKCMHIPQLLFSHSHHRNEPHLSWSHSGMFTTSHIIYLV